MFFIVYDQDCAYVPRSQLNYSMILLSWHDLVPSGLQGLDLTLLLLLLSHFSRVQLCMTPWTVAYQAPLSMGFSRQEHWSGLPFPSPMCESEK